MAFLAGVLILISEVFSLYLNYLDPGATQSLLPIDPWLGLLLGALVQLGLVGLYTPQAKALGALGMVGFFMAFVGTWMSMGSSFIFAFGKPPMLPSGEPEEFFGPLAIFALSFVLGWLLFGVAALRAGIYPQAAVALLISGTLILLLPLPFSSVVFAVGIAWMGYSLWVSSSNKATRSTRRREDSG